MARSWLPVPSLIPSNLQNRLFSYALTHILGAFLRHESFSVENLELQILNGMCSLRNLELDISKVNTLLKLPGIEIVEGRVGEVTVQFPVRDILSGNISVKIHGIKLHVRPCGDISILSTSSSWLIVDKVSEPLPNLSPESLAQSFLQESIHDPEDSVLLDTLSQSIPQPEELGIGAAEGEGIFTSILAGFVDAVKARLAVEITELDVYVQHPRSGAFIISLARIAFYASESNISDKVLSISGIEAYLQRGNNEDDNSSVASRSTLTSPTPRGERNPLSENRGLSESMIFSPQDAESLYMSACSQLASRSMYMSTQIPQLSAEPYAAEESVNAEIYGSEKGFRFLYFEEDLIFLLRSSRDPGTSSHSEPPKAPPAPVLESAIPTAHLFLNPQLNLIPSISLISTILSLSPTTPTPPPAHSVDATGGVDFSWVGGVVVHFGSESEQTIAKFADWKVLKKDRNDNIFVSIGTVEVLSSKGESILSLNESGQLHVTLRPDLLHVSVPEVNLHVELGDLASLQPLIKAMSQAWSESSGPFNKEADVGAKAPDDEEWDEDLIVEKMAPRSEGKNLQLDIQRVAVVLQTNDETIQFTVNEIGVTISATSNTVQFGSAHISLPSCDESLFSITSSSGAASTIEFVFPIQTQRAGFLVNGVQEILDDFLGEGVRSDDAWGMIRADAANKSSIFVKIRTSRIDIRISAVNDIDTVRKVLARVQETIQMFVGDSVEDAHGDDKFDFLLEFTMAEGRISIKLDEKEHFEGKWEATEGTILKDIGSGEIVGVIEVPKLCIDVISPEAHRKIVHKSIDLVSLFILRADSRDVIPRRQ